MFSTQDLSLVKNIVWSSQGVVLVISAQVVLVLGSCILCIRRECREALVFHAQGVNLVFSAQIVVVFRLLHCLCKA